MTALRVRKRISKVDHSKFREKFLKQKKMAGYSLNPDPKCPKMMLKKFLIHFYSYNSCYHSLTNWVGFGMFKVQHVYRPCWFDFRRVFILLFKSKCQFSLLQVFHLSLWQNKQFHFNAQNVVKNKHEMFR